jgi:lipoprotein-anchoring transpeptidase ErfK/SrfK
MIGFINSLNFPIRNSFRITLVLASMAFLTQCESGRSVRKGKVAITQKDRVIVSVKDQKLALQNNGKIEKMYSVSTSKFGLGDTPASNRTPVGQLYVHDKIGVFKGRQRTGATVAPNTPGRDPVVTRIVWLGGLEKHNQNCLGRNIYIHGTPQEYYIGRPASYGCIRMRSRDVIDLYQRINRGDHVKVVTGPLSAAN